MTYLSYAPQRRLRALSRSLLSTALLVCFSVLFGTTTVLAQESTRTGWESLAELTRGNMRFVQGLPAQYPADYARRQKLLSSNAPHAVVVTCADSRMVPEIIFDQGLGNLYVVRTAAFAQDDVTVASVEYGVTKLGIQLVVFLVSDSCAAVLEPEEISEDSVELKALKRKVELQKIDPTPLTEKLRGKAQMAPLEVVLRNVSRQFIERSDVLKQKVVDGKLLFAEATFSFKSGSVDFLQVGMPELKDFKLMFRKAKPQGFQSSAMP